MLNMGRYSFSHQEDIRRDSESNVTPIKELPLLFAIRWNKMQHMYKFTPSSTSKTGSVRAAIERV